MSVSLLYRTQEFSEATRITEYVKSLVERKFERDRNLINNKTCILDDPEKGDPVTPCMDVYKSNIKSDRSLDKLKLIIVFI